VLRPILVHAVDQSRGGDHPRTDNSAHSPRNTHPGAGWIAGTA
jgi:hypothetical protein